LTPTEAIEGGWHRWTVLVQLKLGSMTVEGGLDGAPVSSICARATRWICRLILRLRTLEKKAKYNASMVLASAWRFDHGKSAFMAIASHLFTTQALV
jgi:hypothetical protein